VPVHQCRHGIVAANEGDSVMTDVNRRKLLTVCALAPFGLAIASKFGFGAEGGNTKTSDVKPVAFETAKGSAASRRFPNVEVINHEGKKLRFYDDLIKDKMVMINFFYAKCDKFCPIQTANLVKVQKLLGDRVGRDIFMYSLTLKPEEDSPEALNHYVMMNDIKPGWQLLTGRPGDMEELRVKLGFRDSDPEIDKDKSNHIGLVLFGNDKLNRWTGCPAASSPQEIVREVLWLDEAIPSSGD